MRFGEEEGLDERTMSRVVDELASRAEAMALTREDVRLGAITAAEGRDELEGLRAASDAELVRILGERRFRELSERLQELAPPR